MQTCCLLFNIKSCHHSRTNSNWQSLPLVSFPHFSPLPNTSREKLSISYFSSKSQSVFSIFHFLAFSLVSVPCHHQLSNGRIRSWNKFHFSALLSGRSTPPRILVYSKCQTSRRENCNKWEQHFPFAPPLRFFHSCYLMIRRREHESELSIVVVFLAGEEESQRKLIISHWMALLRMRTNENEQCERKKKKKKIISTLFSPNPRHFFSSSFERSCFLMKMLMLSFFLFSSISHFHSSTYCSLVPASFALFLSSYFGSGGKECWWWWWCGSGRENEREIRIKLKQKSKKKEEIFPLAKINNHSRMRDLDDGNFSFVFHSFTRSLSHTTLDFSFVFTRDFGCFHCVRIVHDVKKFHFHPLVPASIHTHSQVE